jgi:hypothetical protein
LPFQPDRILVATDRCAEYTALSIGCNARRALLTALGVMARFTARPGCIERRTLRGTSSLEKKPTFPPTVKRLSPKGTPANDCLREESNGRYCLVPARRHRHLAWCARPELDARPVDGTDAGHPSRGRSLHSRAKAHCAGSRSCSPACRTGARPSALGTAPTGRSAEHCRAGRTPDARN